MNVFGLLMLAVIASSQQFQQDSNPSVWLAAPGYFQQEGRYGRPTSQSKSSSFQSIGSTNKNQQGSSVGEINSQLKNSYSNQPQVQQNQLNQIQLNTFEQSGSGQFQSIDMQDHLQQFQPSKNILNNRFQDSNSHQNSNSQFQINLDQQNHETHQRNRLNLQTTSEYFQNNKDTMKFNHKIQDSVNSQKTRDQVLPNTFLQNSKAQFQSNDRQGTSRNTFQTDIFQATQSSIQAGLTLQQNLEDSRSSGQLDRDNTFQSTSNNQRFSSDFQTQFPNNNRATQGSQSQSNNLHQSSSRSNTEYSESLNLPSGIGFSLDQISTSFSCSDRPYGYYADEENSCRVFHVCNPALFESGKIHTNKYSFMCGEGTQFDQEKLTCVVEYDAIPCQESRNYYSKNDKFGLQEENSF